MNCSTSTFLTRWARKIDDETDWTLQLYYYNPFAVGQNRNNSTIFDTDFQYHFKRDRHDVVCGCGYRNCDEEFIGGGTMAIIDSEQIPNYLIQDTITLVEDRFFLTLGSKFDHNSVTTFEFQPTVRAMWTPNKETSIWAAISHAARTPALQERMFFTPNAEDLMAYEMGIRRQPNEKFFWDLAVFDNRYSGLLGWNSPFVYQNVGNANTYGFECSSTYTMNSRWHLTGSYSFLIENYQWAPGYSPENPDGSAPRNQFYLQSGWDLGKDVTFDVMFRYVDSLVIGVPSYFANDVRVAWRPARHLELSLVGQNLLAGKHYEFISSSIATPTEIGPAVYGMVTWRY
jgi:iron complex outermembrane receptor protein